MRRRRRLFRFLLVLVVTPALIATDLLGTVPDSPLSAGLRQAISIALPPEFVAGLNARLDDYGMPTLPPAPEGRSEESAAFVDALVVSLFSTPTPTPTTTPTPTLTSTPTRTTTPIITDTLDPTDISGTWLFLYGMNEYSFEDVFTIEKQGSGYVVTSLTNNYGPVTLLDQSWDGSSLVFHYEIPASTFPYEVAGAYVVMVKTLGMENGHLVIVDEVDFVYELSRID